MKRLDALREEIRTLRALGNKILDAQEAERRAIVRELHDEIGQNLALAQMQFSTLEQNDTRQQACCAGMHSLDRALSRASNLMAKLRPALLDDFGLEAAMRWCAQRSAKPPDLQIQLEIALAEARLSPRLKANSFYLVAELLEQAQPPCTVRIRIAQNDRQLEIAAGFIGACDFSPAEASALVLDQLWRGVSMQERIALLQGRLEMNSRPGEGMSVKITLPVLAA